MSRRISGLKGYITKMQRLSAHSYHDILMLRNGLGDPEFHNSASRAIGFYQHHSKISSAKARSAMAKLLKESKNENR